MEGFLLLAYLIYILHTLAKPGHIMSKKTFLFEYSKLLHLNGLIFTWECTGEKPNVLPLKLSIEKRVTVGGAVMLPDMELNFV